MLYKCIHRSEQRRENSTNQVVVVIVLKFFSLSLSCHCMSIEQLSLKRSQRIHIPTVKRNFSTFIQVASTCHTSPSSSLSLASFHFFHYDFPCIFIYDASYKLCFLGNSPLFLFLCFLLWYLLHFGLLVECFCHCSYLQVGFV